MLMLLAIATYPETTYLEYPNALDNAYLNDYVRIISLLTFIPFGFWVMAPLLIISMVFHASTEAKTVFVGGMSAAPVMFGLAQDELILPSGQFDAMFVLAPTLALIAVGVVMFGFFKLHRVDAGQFGDWEAKRNEARAVRRQRERSMARRLRRLYGYDSLISHSQKALNLVSELPDDLVNRDRAQVLPQPRT